MFAPNGFLRRFVGNVALKGNQGPAVQVAGGYDVANGNLQLRLANPGKTQSAFKVDSAYNSPISGERRVRGGDVIVQLAQRNQPKQLRKPGRRSAGSG
ncbi:hypothetical protein [Paraburkholderia sp. DGU8]|uniref:hypothetical protein n=1 Tax=Paraburkholderia sp. DGU8 TaxID=3161997 RepID=UPI0034674DE1